MKRTVSLEPEAIRYIEKVLEENAGRKFTAFYGVCGIATDKKREELRRDLKTAREMARVFREACETEKEGNRVKA